MVIKVLYSSVDNQKIKNIKKLYTKKYRDLEGKFIIEGEHLALEAYKNNLLEELLLLDGSTFKLDVPISYVTEKVMKYISELDTPPNIIGICKKLDTKDTGSKILILDGIQDPGNLGTIIRSSVAFNIDTILLSEKCVSIYNPKVLRATQGMIFNINILEKEIIPFIIELKSNGYKIYSTKVDGGKDIRNVDTSNKYALVMGSEGLGVSKDVLSLSDEYIYIKMNNQCESLNVGVATSIILYEFNK